MVGPIGKSGGVSTHTKNLLREFDREGVEYYFFNTFTKRGWRPGRWDPVTIIDHLVKLFRITFLLPLFALKNRKEVRLIHVQASGPIGGFLPALMGAFLKRTIKRELVITFHHSKTDKFIKEHRRLFDFVLKRCDHLIVVSERQKAIIRKHLGDEHAKKITNIPNGYDRDKFENLNRSRSRKRLSIHEDTLILLNVAWVMEKKGHPYLIEALKKIEERVHDLKYRCIVIGKGPDLEKMRQLVKEKGLSHRIKFLGYVSDEDLLLYLSSADIFVLPSLEEGNPIVMFEALGVGLPIISTDVGGIPEIIRSPDHGILVKPRDPDGLAKAIEDGMKKRWDRKRIREYGRRYSWNEIAKRTLDVYAFDN